MNGELNPNATTGHAALLAGRQAGVAKEDARLNKERAGTFLKQYTRTIDRFGLGDEQKDKGGNLVKSGTQDSIRLDQFREELKAELGFVTTSEIGISKKDIMAAMVQAFAKSGLNLNSTEALQAAIAKPEEHSKVEQSMLDLCKHGLHNFTTQLKKQGGPILSEASGS